MQILMPMAGVGSRFVAEGYVLPKPLIEVRGKPMVIRAVQALPQGDAHVFIIQKEQEEIISPILKNTFANTTIIALDYITEGQASTCLLAKSILNLDEALIIGACDNGMTYNRSALHQIIADPSMDAAVFTFRNNPTVKRNPQMYGWVKTDENKNALDISCKLPISAHPIDDHAIVGAFYFRKAAFAMQAIEAMQNKNIRVNKEFYLDLAINELIQAQYKVKVFEVDKYICWGTPNDLKTYQYWERYFNM